MASIKDLKKRIQSTKSTQQTTKAMKMVSAAYLRRAQEVIAAQRPYAQRISGLLRYFASMPELPVQNPLLKRTVSENVLNEKKRLLILVVTSNRGLAAGFNANVNKTAQRWAAEHQNEYASIEWAFVGRKGYEFFRNRKVKATHYFQELSGKVSFAKARTLSNALVESFTSGQVDEIKVVYNVFQNAMVQTPTVEQFLPWDAFSTGAADAETSGDSLQFMVRPSSAELLEQLLQKNFPVQAFRILLESQAGEHGARMSAMDNATRNAGDMIAALGLEYNKQRQAGITSELLEIIAGSESQKVS